MIFGFFIVQILTIKNKKNNFRGAARENKAEISEFSGNPHQIASLRSKTGVNR